MESTALDVQASIDRLETAVAANQLSSDAAQNIRTWLTETSYTDYVSQVVQHIADEKWQQLDDVFWTIIPFGTGGRRGRMYPIGSNAINDRTIGESAQGLADYVKGQCGDSDLSCAIAYDTRHRSREFAELCAGIMVAAGFKVFFLDEFRSTPELSFLVRHKGCSCGIMVTASHNPPSDNAVKVYWSTGGQLVPPHDKGVIQCVGQVTTIESASFSDAVSNGQIEICNEEVDTAFFEELKGQSFPGPRDIKIVYSPLHGVGEFAVCPTLEAAGFENVEVFEPHREPSGDFPNVPGHVSNPENPAVFESIIEHARKAGADIILASDPDCDRLGAAAPLTLDTSGQWKTFDGNQLGALLADYVLEMRSNAGTLSSDHYVIKTLVTTELIRRIADSYDVRTQGNLLVGYKWIGELMDKVGPDQFVFGAEESHGYLVGQYARDKDGAVASMLMAELAAKTKAEGKSLHEKLGELHLRHGYHAERLLSVFMEGSDGMRRMQALMTKFRNEPPERIGGIRVVGLRDYLNSTIKEPGAPDKPLDGPVGNLLIFDLEEDGNYIAVRPSGTEPKVKFYMFTFAQPSSEAELADAKQQMSQRTNAFESDLRAFTDLV